MLMYWRIIGVCASLAVVFISSVVVDPRRWYRWSFAVVNYSGETRVNSAWAISQSFVGYSAKYPSGAILTCKFLLNRYTVLPLVTIR